MSNKIIAVCGPTASGKTELAIKIAQKYKGEIVSCDSMQIYKGMDIGTAKPDENELNLAPHHLIGVIDTDKEFSVVDFVDLASKSIEDIKKRDRLPILAGGTGLYMHSLVYGIDFDDNSRDEKMRSELFDEFEKNGIDSLYSELIKLDGKAAEKIHKNNTKRVLRALEYIKVTGKKFSEQSPEENCQKRYDTLLIVLSYRNTDILYERINRRVDIMMEKGLLKEAEEFYKSPDYGSTATQAIGYKEFIPYFNHEISLQEAVENIKKSSRHYAKRQNTWFRREKDAVWVFADDYISREALFDHCYSLIDNFLNN